MPCTQAQQAIISRAYMDMPEHHHSFTDCKQHLLQICIAEEREHRKVHYEHKYHMTVALAARYMASRYVAQEILKPKMQVKDYLGTKRSAFYAAAMVHDARESGVWNDLVEWATSLPKEFWALDYAQMVKPAGKEVAA